MQAVRLPRRPVKTPSLLVVCGILSLQAPLTRSGTVDASAVAADKAAAAAATADVHGARSCGGEPCDAVTRGLLAFFDRRLDGLGANGRACADCHMATDNFQLSPASVEARFRLLQWRLRFNGSADDPLFRPVDADDFRINGEDAHDYRNLRQNGLVRITFDLPPNMRLIDPATDCRRPRPSWTCGAACRPSTTSRSRDLTTAIRGSEVRTRQVDISSMRVWRRCRSRRWPPSPITPRPRTPRRRNCSTIWRPSSGCCSPVTASAISRPRSPPARRRCPMRILR